MIGAVYLDQGLDAASELVHRLFDPLIEKSSNLGAGLDWKTSLQELTATEGLGVPEYVVTEAGPDHEKTFTAAARVGGVDVRHRHRPQQEGSRAAGRRVRLARHPRQTGRGRGGVPGRRRAEAGNHRSLSGRPSLRARSALTGGTGPKTAVPERADA